jgi:hypothetical protein
VTDAVMNQASAGHGSALMITCDHILADELLYVQYSFALSVNSSGTCSMTLEEVCSVWQILRFRFMFETVVAAWLPEGRKSSCLLAYKLLLCMYRTLLLGLCATILLSMASRVAF